MNNSSELHPAEPERLPVIPFPGIEPFSYAYRNLFFARETEVRTLIRFRQIILA